MVKHSRFAKIRESRESFPPRMFCRIRYTEYYASGSNQDKIFTCTKTKLK